MPELETKPTELKPASPELKGEDADASRIPSDEAKPVAEGLQPEAGEVVRGGDVEQKPPVEPEPVVKGARKLNAKHRKLRQR